ncbi:MAG: Flp pilus assembly complex ATPase component TadA, partial [Streptococcaceae bacterium]|nr:Flp pilus assembly complex ATPase component TadA [Streptococcaceae bacterium]
MDISKIVMKQLKLGRSIQAEDYYLLPTIEGYRSFFRKGNRKEREEVFEAEVAEKIILHLKYRAGMNVGERRRAQLGSFSIHDEGRDYRFRVSTVGDFMQKESLVLRFLHSFEEKACLYFDDSQIQEIQRHLLKRGLFLFSGPTGSGKTTSMFQLALSLNKNQMISIEDPVEIENKAVLQLQVNEAIGMTYEALIKLCLRHRPDIVFVGEIRDEITLRSVIRATLTGHTVFSTLHAKNVEGVKARLIELGATREELKICLGGIVYQRLLEDVAGDVRALFEAVIY